MAGRRLSPEEQLLWNAVAGTVRPMRPQPKPQLRVAAPMPASPKAKPLQKLTPAPPPAPPTPVRAPAVTLDSSWEKRIRGGTLTHDMAIDLHGHNLPAAHARLNQALAAMLTRGLRVLLVVTGKPRKSDGYAGSGQRGAIRAEIGHWLGHGLYADRIASVRVAHPRHGGDGALYVILRRTK